ncbi:unnamed protein product [Calypogeia fissa]
MGRNAATTGTQTEEGIWDVGQKSDQPRARQMVTIATQTDESFLLNSKELNRQLLPGLHDEITLVHIVPKLPWWAFYVLACVCRSWKRVVRSGKVHDARIDSSSTETLVGIVAMPNQPGRKDDQVVVYSMSEKLSWQLPPFPASGGIPESCQRVTLDGKIYVLGGRAKLYDIHTSEVWVFDLVGQKGWEKLANMHEPRCDFGSAVKDGKIFVFGGFHRGSEVYEPKDDIWVPISSMVSVRVGHKVATFGEELIVYGGYCFNRDSNDCFEILLGSDLPSGLEIYHPEQDDWRVDESVGCVLSTVLVFTAHEKFYLLGEDGIDFYDDDKNAWVVVHSNSFAALGPEYEYSNKQVETVGVLNFNDELLLAVTIHGLQDRGFLLQSTSFGSDDETIEWQKENISLRISGSYFSSPLIGLIHL